MKVKIVIFAILILVAVFFILEFIPIRLAVKKENISYNNSVVLEVDSYQTFICRAEPKLTSDTSVRWIAEKQDNPHLDKNVYLVLTGNIPHKLLSDKDYDVNLNQNTTNNKFVVSGVCVSVDVSDVYTYNIVRLNVEDWDIVSPIKRLSFRRFYAPKSYLTIYDFNWSEFFKKEDVGS